MYLFVLGNFPLSLCIFNLRIFFFQDRIQHCFLQNLNTDGEINTYFIIMLCLGTSATYLAFNPIGHEMGVESLKLVSLNVKGISNFHKRKTIYTWCRKKNADFSFLQETHSKKELETQWKNEWGAEIIMSHASSNSRGVAILIKKGVDYTPHS